MSEDIFRTVAPVDDQGLYLAIQTRIPGDAARDGGRIGATLWIGVAPRLFGAGSVVISGVAGRTAAEAFEHGHADAFDYAGGLEAIEAAKEWAERLERVAAVAIGGSEPEGWIRHASSGRRRRRSPYEMKARCRTCNQAIKAGQLYTFTEPRTDAEGHHGATIEHATMAECFVELEGDAARDAVTRAFDNMTGHKGGPRGRRIPEGD